MSAAGWTSDAPTGGWRALTDLVLPRTCAGCGVPGAVLCAGCRRWLALPQLAQPRRHPAGFPPTVAAGAYAGPVRPAVLAFKEHGRAELAGPLGTALALAVTAVLAGLSGGVPVASGTTPPGPLPTAVTRRGPVLLVAVPSSPAAVQRRGRDHVRELAGRAAIELRAAGVPAHPFPVLRRRGRSRDSAGLDVAERRANLAGRFRCSPPRGGLPAGAVLVLLDDVVSSGATLAEAARALSDLPPPDPDTLDPDTPVLAAVVAATPRRCDRRRPPTGPGTFTVRR